MENLPSRLNRCVLRFSLIYLYATGIYYHQRPSPDLVQIKNTCLRAFLGLSTNLLETGNSSSAFPQIDDGAVVGDSRSHPSVRAGEEMRSRVNRAAITRPPSIERVASLSESAKRDGGTTIAAARPGFSLSRG